MPKSYKREHPTENYDCLIIGSGISGMALAALLAKEGRKCLVLEKHYTPGGFTHVFKRRNYEWDVGIHYIGEVHRPQSIMRQMFDYLSENRLEWAAMDDNYDRIYFGKEHYNLIAGKENFINTLSESFPEERRAIEAYCDLVKATSKHARNFFMEKAMPPFLSKTIGGRLRKGALNHANISTKEAIGKLTNNKKLLAVLTGQYGDYGLPPGESSFLMHCGVVRHYMNGGAFPVGGSAQLFDTIEPTIEAAGGAVYTNAEVKKVLIEKGKAVGVEMADGKTIRCSKIVSSAGAHITFQHLLKNSDKVSAIKKASNNLKASACHVCLYIGLHVDNSVLQLPKTNYWIYPENGYDHDANVKNYLNDPENAPPPVVYISFPSAKDPSWDERYPNRSTIEIITLSNYDWFRNWEDTRWHKRGEDYDAFKAKLSEQLLDYLYDYVPQCKGYVDFHELSTPLSTRNFVSYQAGEIYGLNHTLDRFEERQLRAVTSVKNFYLTGQDIVTAGIGGALHAAFITASAMLKKNMLKKVLMHRTKR